jgi:hypothetical protein
MTEVGKDSAPSKGQGKWIEGDHTSIGTGGGAPEHGGCGTKVKGDMASTKGTPVKNVNSGDL